jgi:hypothetical protein
MNEDLLLIDSMCLLTFGVSLQSGLRLDFSKWFYRALRALPGSYRSLYSPHVMRSSGCVNQSIVNRQLAIDNVVIYVPKKQSSVLCSGSAT